MNKLRTIGTIGAIVTLLATVSMADETILNLPLDGENKIQDLSETKATVTAIQGAAVKDDAIVFSAPKSHLNCGTNEVFELGKDDITFVLKVKMSPKQSKYAGLISKGGGSGTDSGYALVYKTPSKGVYLYVSNGKKRYSFASKTIVLNDDKWHTVAVSLSRGLEVIFAVDGKIRGVRKETQIPADNISSPDTALRVGSWNGAWCMVGAMKDVKIMKKSLESTEMAELTK